MTTLKSISTKLNLIDVKKSKLKKAFEELKLHADSHPTFSSLEWEEIDSYFASLQSNLFYKFSLLKDQQLKPDSQRNASAESGLPPLDPIPSRSELKSFCEKMDGIGLRNYIIHHPKERATVRLELADAYKHASDPAVLVLDAIQGFWPDGSGFGELGGVRRACVVLLEQLGRLGLEIPEVIKERAERLAVEWKGKIGTELGSAGRDSAGGGGRRRRGPSSAVSRERLEEGLEKKGLLYLLAAFRLETGIVLDKNELVDYAVAVSTCREAPELCHSLDFGDEICDVVQKLIDSGKQLIAVKFILQFELTNKFPPVPLLKSYISDSRKIAHKIRSEGKGSRQSVNEAAAKEISSMKSVLKIIEDHNLEAEYPKDGLLKNIEKLEKGKLSSNKRGAPNAPKSERPPKQQQREGRSRTTTRRNGPSGASGGRRNVPSMQRPYVQNAEMVDPSAKRLAREATKKWEEAARKATLKNAASVPLPTVDASRVAEAHVADSRSRKEKVVALAHKRKESEAAKESPAGKKAKSPADDFEESGDADVIHTVSDKVRKYPGSGRPVGHSGRPALWLDQKFMADPTAAGWGQQMTESLADVIPLSNMGREWPDTARQAIGEGIIRRVADIDEASSAVRITDGFKDLVGDYGVATSVISTRMLLLVKAVSDAESSMRAATERFDLELKAAKEAQAKAGSALTKANGENAKLRGDCSGFRTRCEALEETLANAEKRHAAELAAQTEAEKKNLIAARDNAIAEYKEGDDFFDIVEAAYDQGIYHAARCLRRASSDLALNVEALKDMASWPTVPMFDPSLLVYHPEIPYSEVDIADYNDKRRKANLAEWSPPLVNKVNLRALQQQLAAFSGGVDMWSEQVGDDEDGGDGSGGGEAAGDNL